MSGTVFIDGGPTRGLPPASSVSSSDGIIVAQGGVAGVPGTATIREATVAQVLTSAAFLPIAGGTITGNLIVNGTTTLTGIPTAPTAPPGTNNTQIATTAAVANGIAAENLRATTAEALLAPKASPALTGVPTAPTAPLGTQSTQIATTAFTASTVAAALFSPSQAPGVLFGLTLSNDAGTPNTVLDISAGLCSDSTNTTTITMGAFTKSIAGGWAPGSGANGMGTGLTATLITWYHVFVIINGGLADVYFDTSVTAANRPLGTTAFRRLGSIRTDGSVHILGFSQNGDEFLWRIAFFDAGAVPLTTAVLVTLTVAPGLKVNALFRAAYADGVNASAIIFTSPDETDQAAQLGAGANFSLANPQLALPFASGGHFNVRTNTSAQIRYRANGTASNVIYISTYGWIDTRGRLF